MLVSGAFHVSVTVRGDENSESHDIVDNIVARILWIKLFSFWVLSSVSPEDFI